MPTVSVIIPTFNRASLITDALDSVFNQTFKDYEIIIIDDGSTDNTEDVIKPYVSEVIYKKQQNSGPSSARSAGLKTASGKYIAFLDSDDIWEPEYLHKCVFVLEKDSKIGFVFVNLKTISLSEDIICPDKHKSIDLNYNNFLASFRNRSENNFYIVDYLNARLMYFLNYISFIQATIIRQDLINHKWWAGISTAEDYLFTIECLLNSKFSVAFTDDILVTLRVHGSNIYQDNNNKSSHIKDTIKMLEYVLSQYHLSDNENKILNNRLAKLYCSLGYYNHRFESLNKSRENYLKSFALKKEIGTFLALIKTFMPYKIYKLLSRNT